MAARFSVTADEGDPDMLGNIVRFDKDDEASAFPASRVGEIEAHLPTGLASASEPTVPQETTGRERSYDLAWMQQVIEQQTLLFESAQRDKAAALAELKRIAQTLCQAAWDAKSRAGETIEDWAPMVLANFIIQSVAISLRNARLSQDPALAEKHRRLLDELAEARADNHRLRQRCRAAEEAVRELRAAAQKETARQQKLAEKRSGAALDRKSPPRMDREQSTSAEDSPPTVVDTQPIPAAHGPVSANALAPDSVPASTVTRQNIPVGTGLPRVDDVVRVIAQTGLCRWKDITNQLANLWDVRASTGSIDAAIKKAIELELLRIEEVRLEWGGKPTGKVLILTEEGRRCAATLNVSPVESHYTRGLALHKDGSHFYAIVEVAAILATQYARVDFFPPPLPLTDGKYLPDVVAIAAGGQRICVEVERGTHKDERDREKKWIRAAGANQGTIYLVTPNLEVMTAIVDEICAIRDRQPGKIDRILAFNVRTIRERKGQIQETLWSSEG